MRAILAVLMLSGCAAAGQVSDIPSLVDGREVFTYTGKATSSGQIEEGRQAMKAKCAAFNGGTPIIVKQGSSSGPGVTVANTNASVTAAGNTAVGNATTTAATINTRDGWAQFYCKPS